jgi:peptide deformylase
MSKIISATDARLNRYSTELSIDELLSPKIQKIIKDMSRIANINTAGRRQNPDKSTLVGLAAPQIGKNVRIILVDVGVKVGKRFTEPNIKFFINPEIIYSSATENLYREGCYSTDNICGAVYRSDSVKISALDENGKSFMFKSANKMQARILQHEIDHLNGIRFPARVRDQAHLHIVTAGENVEYRKRWENWTKIYPIENWIKIHNGNGE